MAKIVNKIIRGSFGRLWVNGSKMANVKSFELKATLKYEAVEINGELCEQNRYVGYSLVGTMTLHQIDDSVAALVNDGIKSGTMPNIKLVSSQADPDSNGSTRIEIYDVTFDSLQLIKFENGKVGEQEVPFKAGGYQYLDMIV